MRKMRVLLAGYAADRYISQHRHIAKTIEQKVLQSGAGISCMCLQGNEVHSRSYPSSFRGNHQMGGYEVIESMRLREMAPRLASEVVQLHKAKLCPSEKMDLIIGKSQLVLQVHESCGHAVELDRVLGYEANFAGTSFLTLDKWKNFKYGSAKVNLYQDGRTPEAIGSAKYDDEGVPCTNTELVRDGQFVGYLKSRDSAIFENGLSNGAARAQGWKNVPIVRMTNIHLAPGNETLDELISSTDRGILMEDNSSWSIDDRRWNFQFATEIGLDGLVVIQIERLKPEKSRLKITKELFKFLENIGYSKALIVTFSEKEHHYRFSLITSDLNWIS